ncbi:MAG: hypothetical protein GZ094_20885 [Mariniphaga sp.]|nr:hypothetical protein [Mariniphaga sp.]
MKNIIIILLLFTVVSCNNKWYFKEKTIKELSSKGDPEIPSVYGYLSMFVLVDSNQIAKTSINLLWTMYKFEYAKTYNKFEDFLYSALNQKLIFKKGYIEKRNGSVFRLNEKIKLEYKKSGISYFVNHYSKKYGEKLEIIRSSLSANELRTIQYYFFINNYKIMEDDLLGTYYVEPFSF